MNKAMTRVLRRVVPSTSRLSHNPIFKLVVNAADLIPSAVWKEFRNLPPNHMRIRVGVGNRIFANQVDYLRQIESFWLYCFQEDYVDHGSAIVDIGCGCGRGAHHLRDYKFGDSHFSGRYIGVDIDPEMLDWCSRNFDARFQFVHSTHGSKSYNQAGTSGKYRLPLGDSSVDFVFSASLFTHLLEPELLNYCEEAFRTLKAGGRMFMHCFCLDHAERTRGGRHTFKHLIGNSHVESLSVPEAAVAYTEAFLLDTAAHVGFRNFRIIAQKDDAWFQPVLLAEK